MHRRRIRVEPLLQRVDTQQGLDRNVGNEALQRPAAELDIDGFRLWRAVSTQPMPNDRGAIKKSIHMSC